MSDRFRDRQRAIYDFGDEFLVHCPRCNHLAFVRPLHVSEKPNLFAPHRVVCSYCAYNADWMGGAVVVGQEFDWYFRLPLWLQTPCCGESLWVYNKDHLDFLEEFVSAKIRERTRVQSGYVNKTLTSRLPQWMKSAKNRPDVLRCIAKLRESLPSD